MKGIFKFMTVALAAGLVVSCSDDLGLDQAGKYAVGQEGVGTIVQFEGDLATRLAAKDNLGIGRAATEDFVWKDGEEVRVFSLNQLAQDIFEVATGAGTNTATFTQKVNANLTGQKYAVTESQMIYGISAEPNADGKGTTLPLLTLTLPSGRDILDSNKDGNDFDLINAWTPGGVDGKTIRNFPVPFWGKAEVTGKIDGGFYEDAELTTTVQSLTAALRINLKSLPEKTKYIVLTTHGGQPYRDGVGYLLAENIGTSSKDAYETWYKSDETPKNEDWLVTDGWSEPIAGTLRAVLNPEYTYVAGADKSEWPKLEIDPRLVSSDELIVDISKLAKDDYIVYIPIVCGTYKNLHVIAAKQISEKWRYCYEGTELKNFKDQEFEVNKLYNLDMGLVVLDKVHLDELNDAIKENCTHKGITTVMNVHQLYAYPKYKDRVSDTAIFVNVAGNVQLNIEKIVTCKRGWNYGTPLTVTDEPLAAHSVRWSQDMIREVEVNVPNTWFKYTLNGDKDDVEYVWNSGKNRWEAVDKETSEYLPAPKLNMACPKSDIILGSIDGNKNSLVSVNVLASNTRFLTDPEALTKNGQAIVPEESAAVKIKQGFARVNMVNTEDGLVQVMPNQGYVPGTQGHVLIYTPAGSEWETELDTLDLEGRVGLFVRLDDALVYNLHVAEYNRSGDFSLVTTGSSAIGYIYSNLHDKDIPKVGSNGEHFDKVDPGCWVAYEPIDGDIPGPRGWFKEGTEVEGLGIRSYWTGSALSVRAINPEAAGYEELVYDNLVPQTPKRSYDVRTIWTAAQLASVGEGVYASSLNKSNHEYVEDLSKEVTPKVAVYNIPVQLVKTIWLGAKLYPWIGARARVKGFWLNGENSGLKNMNMIENWPDLEKVDYIVDPHWCCTTCWKNPVNVSQGTISLKEDFGLIRYIQNNDEVTVFNVNLNDVELITDLKINNVGSVVGRISTKKASLYNNKIGEVKIRVPNGNNIAGMVGYTQIGWTPAESDKHAYADLSDNWINSAVGRGPLLMKNNQVWGYQKQPVGFIRGYEYVGGLSGKVEKPTTSEIISNKVNLTSVDKLINIESFYGHAGGLFGFFQSTDAANFKFNIVECAQNIEANGGNFAGRYEGSYVGGLVGRAINTAEGDLMLEANLVSAHSIRAGKSWVGGLVGYLMWMGGTVTVDDSPSFYNSDATVMADYYMVDVSDSIMAKNTCAGGLFGDVILTETGYNTEYIKAAQVKAGLIEATASHAGGLVGMVTKGDSKVGDENWKDAIRDRGVIVQVGKIGSGRAAGGMFGDNKGTGRSKIEIFDGKSNNKYVDYTRNYKTYSFIEVKDWQLTSKPEQNEYYGTFSNVLGYMEDVLAINNDLSTEGEYNTPSYFYVIDHLDATKKKEIGYQLHSDQAHNIAFFETQKYWGDKNGYMGWRQNQPYYIGEVDPMTLSYDDDHTVVDEQLSSYGLPTACLYFQVDNYAQDSKLPKSGTLKGFVTSK